MTKKQSVCQRMMDERIYFPGAPQLVVTRGWAYQFMWKKLGFDPSERGIGSLDYMVFSAPSTNEALGDLNVFSGLLARMEQDYSSVPA